MMQGHCFATQREALQAANMYIAELACNRDPYKQGPRYYTSLYAVKTAQDMELVYFPDSSRISCLILPAAAKASLWFGCSLEHFPNTEAFADFSSSSSSLRAARVGHCSLQRGRVLGSALAELPAGVERPRKCHATRPGRARGYSAPFLGLLCPCCPVWAAEHQLRFIICALSRRRLCQGTAGLVLGLRLLSGAPRAGFARLLFGRRSYRST